MQPRNPTRTWDCDSTSLPLMQIGSNNGGMKGDGVTSPMTVETRVVVSLIVGKRESEEGVYGTVEVMPKEKMAFKAKETQVVQVACRATPSSGSTRQGAALVATTACRRGRIPPRFAVALACWFALAAAAASAGIGTRAAATTTTTITTDDQQRQKLQQYVHQVAQTVTAPAPVVTATDNTTAAAMQESEPVAAAVVKKVEETVVAQTFTNDTTNTASAAAGAMSALHPPYGVVGAFPHDLAAYWSFNDSYHLSHLGEFDHTHFQGAGVPVTMDVSGAGSSGSIVGDGGSRSPSRGEVPVFDNNLVTNVTAQLGGPAFLRCRVRNLGERPVSWIRRRDWHILTSGVFTYTNDERFQVVHAAGGDEWTLHIKYVQKRDNGTYECQVATGGGVMSHYFNLHVVVPAAFILGSGEYHIGEGSTISLVCIIENSPSPPQYVFWYHNENMINYDNLRGGITVSTEPGPKTHSRLIINLATRADSGNYTCRASNTEADTIFVFISKGDNTAAIQRQESAAPDALRRPSIDDGDVQRLWAVLAAAIVAAVGVPFALRPMELRAGPGAR